ncbi:type I phosphodiesterase/nucleotide pyrophosphatase [Methanosalsum zhilinae DSM 4017]|uniref:Type I phosphodiesterase/nucleotide pyrophosphatase n=1 Tax=Methanosalsum zhilinae (strain DSM 4017 / NBRC 107636 / OCM 62 / WeN5) TaxID=679901 RepID=F7XMA9_METZD|nr:alkaline phosphatase family protein [Methanosalsum zhilinae]AEH61004.1 type I phosphodiesterase/nucleotide pyrophosphatase [Methanosalsum zhilinae DSM 4017]
MKFQIPHSFRLIYLAVLIIIFAFAIFTPFCAATTEILVNPVNNPSGAVILVIDGLGSKYIYPEFVPYTLEGEPIDKPHIKNLSEIYQRSVRVINVNAPETFTEAGHSVIVTGNSGADGEMVSYDGSTIYDVLSDRNYLNLAILQKGSFKQMRDQQDILAYDRRNSINNPQMNIGIGDIDTGSGIGSDIFDILTIHSIEAPAYIAQFPQGSVQRYDAYNRWAIEAAIDIIEYMDTNAPTQKYMLTINVGAVDSAGHYLRDGGYIQTIEGIDRTINSIYDICHENNLLFVITSDHGMAFEFRDSRGGHSSSIYSSAPESQMVPLIVSLPGLEPKVIKGEYGQQDIGPTVLSLLNIPQELRFADGEIIHLKDHANLRITAPEKTIIELYKNDSIIAIGENDSDFHFIGLKPGYNYTIYMKNPDNRDIKIAEKTLFLEGDNALMIGNAIEGGSQQESMKYFQSQRYIAGNILIILINIAGILKIIKIYRDEEE